MSDNLQILPAIFPDHLFLKIDDEDLMQAERASQNYSNQTGKHNAYLNYLCLSLFNKYLQESGESSLEDNSKNLSSSLVQSELTSRFGKALLSLTTKLVANERKQKRFAEKLKVVETQEQVQLKAQLEAKLIVPVCEQKYQFNLSQSRANSSCIIWEFVNGCSLNFNGKKLVIIPSEATDLESFDIPQEWVDIPTWAADYYLPVQVDLEAKYVHFWGFISRHNLKQKAEYDAIHRLYTVEGDDVIEDLELLWIASEMCYQEKGEISPLPLREETEARTLIETLSQPSPYSPRLEVNFEQWGALLSNKDWLQELYLERLIKSPNRPLVLWLNERWNQQTPLAANTRNNQQTPLVSKPPTNQPKTLAVRGNSSQKFPAKSFPYSELETSEKIRWFIQDLANIFSLDIPSNPADEDILLHLLIKSPRQISGEVAEFFWEIVSSEPLSANKQVITILMQFTGNPIILNVASIQTPSQKVALLLRIFSTGEQPYLPPGLRLVVLDEKGHPLPKLEATARSNPLDECIQLYFRADVGDRFSCRVIMKQDSLTEDFII